jgi:ribose/xylose/arabinose/galactoside ABC-type transport system permease subunit
VPWAVLVGLLIGLLVGAANGLGVTWLRVSPFMMTLGTMSISQGIALQLRPQPGGLIPGEFAWLASGNVAGIPIPVIFFALVAAVGFIVLTSTRFGKHVYAVGGNEETTRLSGLPTDRIKFGVYAVSGFCAALGGIFLSSRIRSGDALIGTSFGLDSITAVVLGGTSLFGGRGSLLGTIAGVFIIASLSNIMNLVGVSTYFQYIFKGAILILAVSFYYLQRKK